MTNEIPSRTIKVLDKYFEPYISADKIQERIQALGSQITQDLGDKNPTFLAVLNGAFFFAADLFKALDFNCHISFVKIASYEGLSSSGQVRQLLGLDENLKGKHVVIIEDIVDTGHTMHDLLIDLKKLEPASVKVATLLMKPEALKFPVKPDYIGFEVPDLFLIGYGLDYNKEGRHFNDIYKISNE